MDGTAERAWARGSWVSVDGLRTFYRELGAGEPVLLVHGNPTSSWVWRKVVPYLAQVARPVAPDLYGFGLSEKPPAESGRYHTLAYAEFLRDFCDALGLGRVHLVVHDFGGPFGFTFALANRERVASLAVLNTVFYPDYEWHPWAVEMRKPGAGEALMRSMTPDGVRAFLRAIHTAPVSDEELEPYVRTMLDPAWQAGCLALYRSVPERWDVGGSALLRTLRGIPAVVIWGLEDLAIPARYGPRFAEDLGARLHQVQGAGHFVQEDAPEVVGPLLQEHVRGALAPPQ